MGGQTTVLQTCCADGSLTRPAVLIKPAVLIRTVVLTGRLPDQIRWQICLAILCCQTTVLSDYITFRLLAFVDVYRQVFSSIYIYIYILDSVQTLYKILQRFYIDSVQYIQILRRFYIDSLQGSIQILCRFFIGFYLDSLQNPYKLLQVSQRFPVDSL